ncbi:DNA repair protein RecO [Paenibacillus sp. MBLB4367]|uniref:DNA repair protein RecO n=1 Tax=Paenibacillus sp. MBLB4367 TaxID=3384767 RepID=UPI003907F445
MLYRVQGIVIRSMDYGEGNKILSIYTEPAGKVGVMVRGAKKTNSRHAAVAQLFTYGDFVFYKNGRGQLGTLNHAELIDAHQKLREDLVMAGYGAYMAEMYEKLMPEEEGNPIMFEQLKAGLEAVENGKDGGIVSHLIEMKMLGLSGYLPQLDQCVSCGETVADGGKLLTALSVSQGGVLCPRCKYTDPRAVMIAGGTLKLLRLFQRLDLRRLGTTDIKPATKAELKQCMRSFMDTFFDIRWKSRSYLDQMEKYLT